MSIEGQGGTLPLVKGHSDSKFVFKTCFSRKLLSYLELNVIYVI